jgi:predicted permease
MHDDHHASNGDAHVGGGLAPATVSKWDREAIKQGGVVCLTFAVPFSVIARVVIDDDSASGWSAVLALASFLGFVLGAGVAAWRQQRGTPLSHGIVTATGVFAVAQLVFSVLRLARGDSVNLGRILVSLTLTVGAGLLGGYLGSYLQRQGARPSR